MITDNTRQGGHLHVDLSTSFERILFSHIKDRSASDCCLLWPLLWGLLAAFILSILVPYCCGINP